MPMAPCTTPPLSWMVNQESIHGHLRFGNPLGACLDRRTSLSTVTPAGGIISGKWHNTCQG
jgi:hypothetical protein